MQEDLRGPSSCRCPISLIVLVVVFGGIVAAGLPVVTTALSVAVAMGRVAGFLHGHRRGSGVTVVTLLGLGLAVDYGLLLVARYREELVHGWDPDVAIARAWATAGRTIGFSAADDGGRLSGLLLFDLETLTALGAAGVSIAVVAMFSLTFTAALIGLLKRWVRRVGASRTFNRAEADALADRGMFGRLSAVVQRRPVLVTVLTGAALLAARLRCCRPRSGCPGWKASRAASRRRASPTLAARSTGPPHRPSPWSPRPAGSAVVGRRVRR